MEQHLSSDEEIPVRPSVERTRSLEFSKTTPIGRSKDSPEITRHKRSHSIGAPSDLHVVVNMPAEEASDSDSSDDDGFSTKLRSQRPVRKTRDDLSSLYALFDERHYTPRLPPTPPPLPPLSLFRSRSSSAWRQPKGPKRTRFAPAPMGPTKLTARRKQQSKDIFDELPPLTDIFNEDERYYMEKDTFWTRLKAFYRSWVAYYCRPTFYRVHLLYFSLMSLLGGVILYISENSMCPKTDDLTFMDALFTATSAMTVTGLTVVDFSRFCGFSQFVVLVLIFLGGHVWMTLAPVFVRIFYYRKYVTSMLEGMQIKVMSKEGMYITVKPSVDKVLHSSGAVEYQALRKIALIVAVYLFVILLSGFIFFFAYFDSTDLTHSLSPPVSSGWAALFLSCSSFCNAGFSPFEDNLVGFARQPFALVVTGILVILGNTGFPIMLRFIVVGIHRYKEKGNYAQMRPLLSNPPSLLPTPRVSVDISHVGTATNSRERLGDMDRRPGFNTESRSSSFSSTATSATGPSQTTTSSSASSTNSLQPLVTDFPVYKYMMRYPRKCFTHLFPARETHYLLAILLLFLGVEFVCFLWLDWNSVVMSPLSTGHKIVVGIFQSISTRSAGLNVVDLGLINPAMWVLYLGLMYISAYPVTFAVRESSFAKGQSTDVATGSEGQIKKLSQRLLLRDVTWIYLAFFIIVAAESSKMSEDSAFGVFRILFEIISAYGTVGLSLGYPGLLTSFSGAWTVLSKFVLVVIMLLGRHRGLPDSVDRAVQLPEFLLTTPKTAAAPTTASILSTQPTRV